MTDHVSDFFARMLKEVEAMSDEELEAVFYRESALDENEQRMKDEPSPDKWRKPVC